MKKYLIFIFAYLMLLASITPNLYEASIANLVPPDRTILLGEHIYTYDYNVYISKIRQGQEGNRLIVDKYDNHTNQKGVFLQMFYFLSGKLTSVLGLSPTLTYHLMRIIMAILWITTIILLTIFFLKKKSLINLSIVLTFLTASFPFLYQFNGETWVTFYMNWWQELDILKRISFIPHDTFNYISISILSILLSQINRNSKYFIVICFILFISVFIQPSSALLFIASWCLYQVISVLWSGSLEKANIVKLIKQTFVIFISILIPLLYIKSATSVYPWKSLLDFDQNNRLSVDIKEYILSFGPVFFTGILGMILVLVKKKQELLSLVTWILGVSVLLILFKYFPYQSELRFVQTANYIPLAILSAYLFGELWKNIRVIKIITVITVIIIIFNGLIQVFFSLKSQTQFINQRARATLPLVPYPPQVMYPVNDFYNGLKWLESKTNHQTVVLSKVTAGNYIPAYSGNFVYLGHAGETPDFNTRINKANIFFSGKMNEKQAQNFLRSENISYIFYGPQEKESSIKDIKEYDFLTVKYQSPLVIIYEVIK